MSDVTNTEIAAALDELGDLSELDGAAIYRAIAYRNAAKAVRDSPVSVLGLARQGRATELPGVGAIIQEKIIAAGRRPGEIPATVKLRAKFPPGVIDMTHLPGLGPKRVRRLYEELGIDSLDALRSGGRGTADPQAQGVRAQGRRSHPRQPPISRRRRAPRSGWCSTRRSRSPTA